MKELFAQSLVENIADSDRISAAIPGQVAAKNILFSKFWAQLKSIFGVNNWSARTYSSSPCIVVYEKQQYILDETLAPLPFNSTDFNSELTAGKWVALGGGGGHIITDSDETFPQEPELQFTGNVVVTAGTGKTVVNVPNQTSTTLSLSTPLLGQTNQDTYNVANEAILPNSRLITPFSTTLNFNYFNQHYSDYTQTGILNFEKGSIAFGNGAQIYVKILANGDAINFDVNDFIVIQNDYEIPIATYYDVIFTLRPDGIIRVSIININTDTVPPSLLEYNDAFMNDYVTIVFSEGVYRNPNGTGAIEVADLQITDFVAGGVTSIIIAGLTNTSGTSLVGGETQVRVLLNKIGVADGTEIFKIRAANNTSIYDNLGNAMTTESYAGFIGFEIESMPTISGYYAHYDISSTPPTLNGTKIITISDISGNSRNITQATDTLRPDYSATGGSNNLGYANITGSKLLASAAITLAQPFTVVLVRKIASAYPTSGTGFNGLVPMSSTGVVGIYNRSYVTGSYSAHNVGGIGGTALMPVYANNANNGDWCIDVCKINGTSSAICDNGAIYDEYLASTNPTNLGTTGSDKIQIGITGSNLSWLFSEMIIYSSAVSNDDMSRLFSYLKYKYKINRKPVISVFGDSISAGFNATLNDGFAQIIANSIDGACARWAVSGSGVSTPANSNLIDRVNTAIASKMPKQSYIILQTGTNIDGGINSTWYNGLKSAVVALKNYGILNDRICLASPPYTSTRVSNLTLINNYMQLIASETGVMYANCTESTLNAGGDALIADGVHPNDAGHLVMANTIRVKFGL